VERGGNRIAVRVDGIRAITSPMRAEGYE